MSDRKPPTTDEVKTRLQQAVQAGTGFGRTPHLDADEDFARVIYRGAALAGLLSRTPLDIAREVGPERLCNEAAIIGDLMVLVDANESRQCTVCGCTQENACLHHDGSVCHWVTKDLCSACLERIHQYMAQPARKGGVA